MLSLIDYTDGKAEGLISLMQQSQTLLTEVVDIMGMLFGKHNILMCLVSEKVDLLMP